MKNVYTTLTRLLVNRNYELITSQLELSHWNIKSLQATIGYKKKKNESTFNAKCLNTIQQVMSRCFLVLRFVAKFN